MKISVTLVIQKEFEAESEEAADAKVQALVKAFAAQGWTVSVEDDSVIDDDEEGEEE
jgi:hypothetical protein